METKSRRPKRKFTDEFRLEAVELAKKIGNVQAGKELDLHESLIRQWKKKFEKSSTESKSDKKSYADLERENRRLAKEIGYLKEINKVLKKSTAIFSNDQMGGLK